MAENCTEFKFHDKNEGMDWYQCNDAPERYFCDYPIGKSSISMTSLIYGRGKIIISFRVATGQGKVREIQGQGKAREF